MMAADSPIQVVPLKPEQKKAAGQLLARAFFEYPYIQHLFPDLDQRRRALDWYLGMPVRIALRRGVVLTTPNMAGVAAWIGPEHCQMGPLDFILGGLLELPLRVRFSAFKRMIENDLYVDELRKRYAPPQHWYLWAIGIEPNLQRRGVGKALIEPVLQQADQGGFACFLETHNPLNPDYYRRYGFEIAHAGRVPGPELPVWVMLRPPQTPNS